MNQRFRFAWLVELGMSRGLYWDDVKRLSAQMVGRPVGALNAPEMRWFSAQIKRLPEGAPGGSVMRVPVTAYKFPNGNLIVFDQLGQQVPEYQGPWRECLPRLEADYPLCRVMPATWAGERENPIVVQGQDYE